jgi:hypothetical protein
LVSVEKRRRLFNEIFRVLRRGGRAVIADVVSDEPVPDHLRRNPELWSGCVSGAMQEAEFLRAFEDAGFYGIQLEARASEPYLEVEGIQFRTVTVSARKGKQGACWERKQAVLYRGPFKAVEDDDGHRYERGDRVAVCDKTYRLLGAEPYAGMFELLTPKVEVPLADAEPYDCSRDRLRDPREQKEPATPGATVSRSTVSRSPSACGTGCC